MPAGVPGRAPGAAREVRGGRGDRDRLHRARRDGRADLRQSAEEVRQSRARLRSAAGAAWAPGQRGSRGRVFGRGRRAPRGRGVPVAAGRSRAHRGRGPAARRDERGQRAGRSVHGAGGSHPHLAAVRDERRRLCRCAGGAHEVCRRTRRAQRDAEPTPRRSGVSNHICAASRPTCCTAARSAAARSSSS